jgi:hypothetical protein
MGHQAVPVPHYRQLSPIIVWQHYLHPLAENLRMVKLPHIC